MIGDRINDSYLSPEVAQVPESVSHHMMSHYCMDIQDQAPPRPGSLSLRYESNSNNYVDLKTHQISRNYHSLKRSGSMERDQLIGHLDNNGSNAITPTSFLNPKKITVEQEQFAEQLTKGVDKIKSEREGSHHPSSNTSPGYAPTDRSTNPPSPSHVKLGEDEDGVVESSSPLLLSDVTPLHATSYSTNLGPSVSICGPNPSSNHVAMAAAATAALHNLRPQEVSTGGPSGSPPSTTGDSTSPASPSLDNHPTSGCGVVNRYPIVTTSCGMSSIAGSRYPSLSLPPLRTDIVSGSDAYASLGLTGMLDVGPQSGVGADDSPVPPHSVAGGGGLGGQMIVNTTTDGFLQLFNHSTDQNPLMDPNGPRLSNGVGLSQRHLTNLVSSYESHNLTNPQQEYIPSSLANSYSNQQEQESLILASQKRSLSNNAASMGHPPGVKRNRRRHEPTIAAAQALINATSNGMGQLSYTPTDVANMTGLKMEERSVVPHQSIQPPVGGSRASASIGNSRRVAGAGQSMASYDSRTDASIASMDEEMCSDPTILKIEKKRARNRLAARRCRERKVNKIASLEAEVAMLNSYMRDLRAQLESSQKEAADLRHYMEQLSDSYPGLAEKLKTLVQPSSLSIHQPPPMPES